MKNLTVKGIDKKTGKRISGTGINMVDGNIYLYDRYVWHEIEPHSIRINADREVETYPDSQVTTTDVNDLHERLVQTAIDFCRDNNISEIDEIWFGVDGLQDSVEYGEWTPGTDSSMTLFGIHEGKRKKIAENC